MSPAIAALVVALTASSPGAQPIERGVVVDPVACADDPAQTCALEVAMDAIEWLEIEAMASGRRGRDDELAHSILEKRRARATSGQAPASLVRRSGARTRPRQGVRRAARAPRRVRQMTTPLPTLAAFEEKASAVAPARDSIVFRFHVVSAFRRTPSKSG